MTLRWVSWAVSLPDVQSLQLHQAERCYTWAVEGYAGHESQILTTLQCGPISSPEEAVRAALCENEARALRALRDLK